jgi:hypothetical protein
MKKILLLIVLAFIFSAAPASAEPGVVAAPISTTYCDQSLRGQTSLAPDNDIKAWWDAYERATSVDLVSSAAYQWIRPYGIDYLYGNYRFYGYYGGSVTHQFVCWRDGSGYHDSY